MAGTKARTAIAACALALAAGSGQIATASATAADAPIRVSSPTAAKDAAGASHRRAHHCPTRRVSARAGVVRPIPIRCRLSKPQRAHLVNGATARIANRPDDGRILGVNQEGDLVRYRARSGFTGRDSFVVVRRSRGVRWRMVVRVNVTKKGALAPPANPACATNAKTTNYQTPVELAVTCRGTGVAPLIVAALPSDGVLRNIQRSGNSSSQTLTATYVPNKLFVGVDETRVEAREPTSRTVVPLKVEVRPWRMRALGDSATAGFGFLGTTGKEVPSIGGCTPLDTLNDRCSSNSDAPSGYEKALTWSPDFGLKNNVSWAAQFANQWQGGGHITAPQMFQNRAVTGSTPADWLPTGQLNSYLTTIVDENPDLIAFTLGVNPLLDLILEEGKEGACIRKATTVPAVDKCLEPIFKSVALGKRLEGIYEALLAAPDAEVVTFQYHLAFPLVAILPNFFKPWQVEALIDDLNAEIAAAISAVKAASPPSQASRLTLIEAQVDPNKPDPLKVPRFNLGIPPNPAQSWKASFNCSKSTVAVDGQSHQASEVQSSFNSEYKNQFCEGEPWTIDADTGIHPNRAGYTRFAKALVNVAAADGLVPQLP